MKIKWTSEVHAFLYSELVKRFGSYDTWGGTVPVNQRGEFTDFLAHMAKHVSFVSGNETTPGAVEQQIAWAYTKQPLVSDHYFRQYLSNKYWGLVTGFLGLDMMPSDLLCEYGRVRKMSA